ncbi:MAG: hypothetical protein C5B43_03265 [Verrucomicrobia bacterium]|nr:MAG: hypothetical protein C5B43_03265 [Verrucomicrobiota bacterium]
MNLSAPFIRRPVMTTFVMLAIIVVGYIAFLRLPVNDLPTLEYPEIHVSAEYVGASPEIILSQVTKPLERELAHVKGVKEMTSTSYEGRTSITLTFDLSKDMKEAVNEVQVALKDAEGGLPKEMDEKPSYEMHQKSREAIMWVVVTSDQAKVEDLHGYAEAYLLPRLRSLEGIAHVRVLGSEKSIKLILNPELMVARKIGFNEVIDTVKGMTTQMPLGSIQTNSRRLSLEWEGGVKDLKSFENLKIGKTGVRIKDIGRVEEKANFEEEFHFVRPDKVSQALIFGIEKIRNGNTVAISKSVREVLKRIEKELPASIKINLIFDKAVWIKESLVDVEWSLVFAFVLVVVVIYFSLGRIGEAIIISVALPLSLIGTFIFMYLAGFSLDLLSLLALTLSVGFVVDDSIVVVENIVRTREKGISYYEASLRGSKQICFTIFSMTLSLVAVFIPLLFMPGINGRLFWEFSITLVVAIIISGFISLTLVPMLCSRFLGIKNGSTRLQKKIDRINERFLEMYGKSLRFSFRYAKSIILIAIVAGGGSLFLFSKLSVNLIPEEDRGFFIGFVDLPSGMLVSEANERQSKLEGVLQKNSYIEKALSLNFKNYLVFFAQLKSKSERPELRKIMKEVQKQMNAMPGVEVFMRPYQLINLDMSFNEGGQYEYIVRGLHFEEVNRAVEKLVKVLEAESEFSFVQSSVKNDTPILVMNINEEFVQKFGFSKKEIQQLLQDAYGQGVIARIQKGINREKIYMELETEFQNSLEAPSKLYLSTEGGQFIPLKAFAQWEEKLGKGHLKLLNQLPQAMVRFSLAEKVDPKKGIMRLEEIAARTLPGNVSGELGGSAKMISKTLRDVMVLLLIAAVVMYLVLGILYESFIHPLTILSSIPFATLGGVLILFLFQEPISIFSAVGFLLLIGIVKKNGIMMIDFAVEAQSSGMKAEAAMYEACLQRFRPIMMTTLVAILGAVPIAIGFGDVAEMRRGLGLVIIGGLGFAQFFTLYVTPVIYLTFEKLFSFKTKSLSQMALPDTVDIEKVLVTERVETDLVQN